VNRPTLAILGFALALAAGACGRYGPPIRTIDSGAPAAEASPPPADPPAGENKIEIEELERLEISLIGQGGNGFVGWGTDRSRPLPIGSTLDKDKGIFSWAPAAGFLGRHVLHFAVSDGQALSLPVRVEVTIFPKKYEREFEKKKAER
jgi:hypothetical protein